MIDHLVNEDRCPHCESDFIEEGADAVALAHAVHWLVSEDGTRNSTEARVTRLLDDLREHLDYVEGLEGQASPSTPKVEAAPQEVIDSITETSMDSTTMLQMKQAPQCVICCSDFEIGETLSQLPGCSHLFHDGCIRNWLQRAANCPICRCNLSEAIGLSRTNLSTASSMFMQSERSDSPPSSPSGALDNSDSAPLWHSSAYGGLDASRNQLGGAGGRTDGWLLAEGFLQPPRRMASNGEEEGGGGALLSNPPWRSTSSALAVAGSAISSSASSRLISGVGRASSP